MIEYIPGETGDTATYVVTYDDSVTTLAEIIAGPVGNGYQATPVSDDSSS